MREREFIIFWSTFFFKYKKTKENIDIYTYLQIYGLNPGVQIESKERERVIFSLLQRTIAKKQIYLYIYRYIYVFVDILYTCKFFIYVHSFINLSKLQYIYKAYIYIQYIYSQNQRKSQFFYSTLFSLFVSPYSLL